MSTRGQMQGGDNKTDRDGGRNSENSHKDDDTFRSLLERVDGDFNPDGDPGKDKSRSAAEATATAPLLTPEAPQSDVAPLSDNIISLPWRAATQPLPVGAPEAPDFTDEVPDYADDVPTTRSAPFHSGLHQSKWYHNNWTLITVSILVAVAVCSPFVMLLSYSLQWKPLEAQVEERNDGLPATTDPFSRPPPVQVSDPLPKAGTLARPRGNAFLSPRPIQADAAAPPRLLGEPRLAKQAVDALQAPDLSPSVQSENLPRIILPVQIILLSGPAGKPAPLGLTFAPFALLPKGSFVMIRGLPSQILLQGGSLRGGVWILKSGAAAAAMLRSEKAAAGSFDIVAALMAPGGREISHAKATVLVVTAKEDLRLDLAPPGAFQPPAGQRGASLEVQALLNQGVQLIASGDIANARAVLKAAAMRGSAAAALTLAESYDPNRITKPPVLGLVVDAAKARKWYLKTIELGGTASLGARLKALPRK